MNARAERLTYIARELQIIRHDLAKSPAATGGRGAHGR
jgi:hypothetical protein